ncbi:MAG TPA: ribonuclease J [Micropepsaceae bacterium]|jgi:ribonuclease J|nr:ribonuclease J [Micropepsaceae bacterium]
MNRNTALDAELVFLPLGGAGEIGMNLNCYGYGPPEQRKWIVVDCGVLFGRETSTPGVDLMMPDIRFLEELREDVLGLVLTHGHEDHLGAVAYLWPKLRCPVYATPFTARLLRDKLEEAGLEERVRVRVVPLSGALTLGPFALEFISITHSIPEPNALAIRTGLGTVVHTGDWKIDPDPLLGEVTNDAALRRLGDEGVLAMVCDSTNALVPGESGSEGEVRRSLIRLIGSLKGRVAVTAFASNVARLQSVAEAAEAAGRELVLVGRSMHRMVNCARDTGYLKNFPRIVAEDEAYLLPADNVLYLCTGSQGEPRAALARIASDNHSNVSLGEGDTVIFSSRIIPGNELAIFELQNQLAAKGISVLTERDHFVHVSGHPARDELAAMYSWVKPRIAVPVHGELRHMSEHARLAESFQVPQAVVALNGQMVRLAPGHAEIIDETPAGRLHMDGKVLVHEDEGFAKARRSLGYAGFIGVTLVLDRKGRVAADPVLHLEGIPDAVHEPVRDAVMRAANGKRGRNNDLAEEVRLAARRAANESWGKKPVVRVQTIEL